MDEEVHCVFANYGPYFYKVRYTKNKFAGLITESKTRYFNYLDNRPVSIDFNNRYIVLYTISSSTSKPNLLIYRDQEDNGSEYLHSGINLEEYTNIYHKNIKIDITDDNFVVVTVNRNSSLIKKFHLSDMILKPKSDSLEALENSKIIFNQDKSGSSPTVKIPMNYLYLRRNEQKTNIEKVVITFKHWIFLVLVILAIVFIIGLIQRKEFDLRKKIRDSGIRVGNNEDKATLLN